VIEKSKVAPHLAAAALLVVVGVFLFNYVTVEAASTYEELAERMKQDPSYPYANPTVFGYRPYGIAIVVIGIAYMALTFFRAKQKPTN
jgi:hypothetical protein